MRLSFLHVPWSDWEVYRKAFRLRGGPMPPTILIMLSVVVMLSELEPGFGLLAKLWRGLLVFMGIIGMIAAIGASRRSTRWVRRLGIRGWKRPRWWFAQSHLAFTFFAFTFLLIGFAFPASRIAPLQLWIDDLWPTLCGMLVVSFCIFSFAVLGGYAASAIRGRFPRGDAYACVHVAFLCLGGVVLATIAGFHWPPRQVWPDGVLVAICGPAGLALLVLFLVLGPKAIEKLEKRA